jgi:hypothetical protein
MAFTINGLGAISVANENTGAFYKYMEDETLANMRASGYFDDALHSGLSNGDVLMLIGNDGIGFNQVVVTGTVYTLTEAITSV